MRVWFSLPNLCPRQDGVHYYGGAYFVPLRIFVSHWQPRIQPTPLAAAHFIIVEHIIKHLGPIYSHLSPKLYTSVFLCCVSHPCSFFAVGGGLAAAAVKTAGNLEIGGNIMLVTITAFVVCAREFLLRFLQNRPVTVPTPSTKSRLTPRMTFLICALVFNITCHYIRAVYRVIELVDGWTGRIIHTHFSAYVLDGAMIVLAVFTLNLAHTGFLLDVRDPAGKDVDRKDGIESLALVTRTRYKV
ncbi:RTA1 like protein-domain-containing protein [Mycena crocata]|nr:RTA1 like protein-domain-containing protein [Mycena crocata]